MASTSETGHAKNVAEFEDLLKHLTSLGDLYMAPLPELSLASMLPLLESAQGALYSLKLVEPVYNSSVDANTAAFAPVDKLITRSLGFFKVVVKDAAQTESAVSLAKKIRGTHSSQKTTKEEPATVAASADGTVPDTSPAPEKRTHSTSQQSYDMIIDNFEKYIVELEASGKYAPAEIDLALPALKQKLDDLKATSGAIVNAHNDLAKARGRRNEVIYHGDGSLVEVGIRAIQYVKSAIPETNPLRDRVLAVKLKRLK